MNRYFLTSFWLKGKILEGVAFQRWFPNGTQHQHPASAQ